MQKNQLRNLQLDNIIKLEDNDQNTIDMTHQNQCYLPNIQEVTENTQPSNLKSLTTDQSNYSKSAYNNISQQNNGLQDYNTLSITINNSTPGSIIQKNQLNGLQPIQYIQVQSQQSDNISDVVVLPKHQMINSSTIINQNVIANTNTSPLPTQIKELEQKHKQQTETQRRLQELQHYDKIHDQFIKTSLVQLYIKTTEQLKQIESKVQLKIFHDIVKIKKPSKEMHNTCDIIIKLVEISKGNIMLDLQTQNDWEYIIDYIKTHGKLIQRVQKLHLLFDDDIHKKKYMLQMKDVIQSNMDYLTKEKGVLSQIIMLCVKLIEQQQCLFGEYNQIQANKSLSQSLNKHKKSLSETKPKLIVKKSTRSQSPGTQQINLVKINQNINQSKNNDNLISLTYDQGHSQNDYAYCYDYDQDTNNLEPKIYLNERSKVIHIDLSHQNEIYQEKQMQQVIQNQQQTNQRNIQSTPNHWSFNTPQTPENHCQIQSLIKIENQGYTTGNNKTRLNSNSTSIKVPRSNSTNVTQKIQNSKNTKQYTIRRANSSEKSRQQESLQRLNQTIKQSNNSKIKSYNPNNTINETHKRVVGTNLNPIFQSNKIDKNNTFSLILNPMEQQQCQQNNQKTQKSLELEKKREQLIQQWTQTLLQEQELQDKIRQRLEQQLKQNINK